MSQMHQQARPGIDFDDGTTLLVKRTGNVFTNEVDAGNIEANNARRQGGNGRDAWMYQVGRVNLTFVGYTGAIDHIIIFQTSRHDTNGGPGASRQTQMLV